MKTLKLRQSADKSDRAARGGAKKEQSAREKNEEMFEESILKKMEQGVQKTLQEFGLCADQEEAQGRVAEKRNGRMQTTQIEQTTNKMGIL